jgi:hypothetical protein
LWIVGSNLVGATGGDARSIVKANIQAFVKEVVCGSNNTIAITNMGQAYGTGKLNTLGFQVTMQGRMSLIG